VSKVINPTEKYIRGGDFLGSDVVIRVKNAL